MSRALPPLGAARVRDDEMIKLASRAVSKAPRHSVSLSRGVMTEDTGPEIDGCAFLFRVCKELQRSHLDHRETELLFDVEPGNLPARVCHSLASLLRNVVSELAESELSTALNGVVGVTLRRRGTACMVVLSDRGLRDYDAQPQFD